MISRKQNLLNFQRILLSVIVVAQCLSSVVSFVALAGKATVSTRVSSTLAATDSKAVRMPEVETSDDPTKPSYEIEPTPIRIGHGFDIHRMAPIEEAGQPVVIGGVEIPHKDQKVRVIRFEKKCIYFAFYGRNPKPFRSFYFKNSFFEYVYY